MIPKETLTELKKLRDYFESGEYKKNGGFDMNYLWDSNQKCGCVYGHYERFIHNKNNLLSNSFFNQFDYYLFCFLFSDEWKHYDKTLEGAIGRIDSVLDGLRM